MVYFVVEVIYWLQFACMDLLNQWGVALHKLQPVSVVLREDGAYFRFNSCCFPTFVGGFQRSGIEDWAESMHFVILRSPQSLTECLCKTSSVWQLMKHRYNQNLHMWLGFTISPVIFPSSMYATAPKQIQFYANGQKPIKMYYFVTRFVIFLGRWVCIQILWHKLIKS